MRVMAELTSAGKRTLALWLRSLDSTVTYKAGQFEEMLEVWCAAGMRRKEDLGVTVKEADLEKVPKYGELNKGYKRGCSRLWTNKEKLVVCRRYKACKKPKGSRGWQV